MRLNGHPIALWAGVVTFASGLAAINLTRLLGSTADVGLQAASSAITAALLAAGVYAKQRLDEARKGPGGGVGSGP